MIAVSGPEVWLGRTSCPETAILRRAVGSGRDAARMTDTGPAVHRTVLPATEPFSFALSLRALAGFAPCARDHQPVPGGVRKAFLLRRPPGRPDAAAVAEVGAAPDGMPGVTLTVYAAAAPTADEVAGVEGDVARWLGLDDDLVPFLAAAAADPAMAAVLAVARGLHQVRFASLVEAAVHVTLAQRSAPWFAAHRRRRIARALGPRLPVDGVTHVAFPSAATLLALTDDELAAHTGSVRRSARLRAVVSGVAALDERWLRAGAYDDVRRALLAVPGVGPFTAQTLLLRALGRPDDAPLETAQLTLAARAVYGDPPPAPGEIRRRYGPWVGWWACFAHTARPWLVEPARAPEDDPAGVGPRPGGRTGPGRA